MRQPQTTRSQRVGLLLVGVGALCAFAGFLIVIFGGFEATFSKNPGTWLCAVGLVLMVFGQFRAFPRSTRPPRE